MANETKFGMKPDNSRINYDTLESKIKETLPTAAIWEMLGITEEEYYEKYHRQPIPVKAIVLENEQKTETLEK
jgi:translation elongation factor EF-1beta